MVTHCSANELSISMDTNTPQDRLASVAKNLYQRHTRIITTMIGSFLVILIMAWVFTPRHHFKSNITKAIYLPPEAENIVAQNQGVRNKTHWETVVIKSGDSLNKIFKLHGFKPNQLHSIMQMPDSKALLGHIKPGHTLKFLVDDAHNILQIIYQPNPITQLKISRKQQLFTEAIEKTPIETRQSFRHGEIKASLFSAGLRANLPSKLIMKLVEIFQWDIDFAKNIRPGDQFNLIFEEKFINGESFATGNILAAEFINKGKKYQAFRFQDAKGHTGYYTQDGHSLKRRFTRIPVKFTRISSYFKPRRWHPVLHRFRKHTGVDYAAPTGTPVKATSDGKIKFIGRKGGYGNAIIIDHGNGYTTLYGHMSRFAKHLKKRQPVLQGQTIGYVGMTGLATGPHLHYEFRVHNKHRDPLKVKLPGGRSIPNTLKPTFYSQVNQMMRRISLYNQTELAASDVTHSHRQG